VSDYVVDASVAVKWFLAEVHWEAAARMQGPEHRLHAPAFLSLEFGNVLCKKIRRGEISPQDAQTMLDKLQRVNIHRHQDELLFGPAFQLANEARRSLYDCLYLTLALRLRTCLVTADRRFFDALIATEFAPHLLWVEDLP
jgi:predicted nucleic acid-binding protein